MSDTLPPLPEPHGWIYDGIPNMLLFNRGPLPQTTALVCSTAPVYSADQMRSYAAECVAAERERCAKLADEYATFGGSNFHDWFKKLAEAIRADGRQA